MLGIKHLLSSMLVVVIFISCFSFADTVISKEETNKNLVSTKESETNLDNFENWKKSRFAIFFCDTTLDFSHYNEIIFFPTTYENIIFSEKANHQLQESWKNTLTEEIKGASQDLDSFLERKFASSKSIKLTSKEGVGVLAVQFRMKEFFPSSKNDAAATGTRGLKRDLLGLGSLRIEAVVIDSKTRKLVAMIQDRIIVDSTAMTSNIRINRNVAWSKSMKDIAEKLHTDLEKLKKISKK